MDMFAAVKAFVAVVNEGAFSRAAKQLGLATSSVTRQVDSLEAHLRTILINRSTRRLTLTDAGTDYYDSALQIMQDLEEANASAALVGNRVHGSLRVNAPWPSDSCISRHSSQSSLNATQMWKSISR